MKIFNLPTVALALLLGALTACPAPVPSVGPLNSIAIIGVPADNNLKISVPVQLTAVAKDANGNVLSDVALTWTSSNPDAVGVSLSGLVTAKKFGTATITASSGSVSGVTPMQTTYGLEAVFGTRVYKNTVETHRLYRFRLKVGQEIMANTGLNFVTTGPSGWNNNQTTITPYSVGGTAKNSTGGLIGHASALAVSGNYKMSVIYDGEAFESATSTVDATSKLIPTTITILSASTTSVSASWTPVAGSVSSYASARNISDNSSEVQTGVLTDTTNATFNGLSLDANKSPRVAVFAYNFDLASRNSGAFPSQANGAVEDKAIVLP
jgi:Bacterial Ig-like domain (group 2)